MAPPVPVKPLPQIRLFATTEDQRRAQLEVINGTRTRLADLYYVLLRAQWRSIVAFVTASYLALNAVFGLAYWGLGGVQGTDGGYLDHFFFSVQTFGTIGFGHIYPRSVAANWVVISSAAVLASRISASRAARMLAKRCAERS